MAHQLEGQRRAVDHLAPPAGVRRLGQPVTPEPRRRAVQLLGVVQVAGRDRRLRVEDLQDEDGRVAVAQRELGGDVVAVDRQVAAGRETEVDLAVPDPHAALLLDQPRPLRAVVRARRQPHAHRRLTAHRPHPSHEPLAVVRVVGAEHGHEVVHLDQAARGVEAGDQDVGVGQVELPCRRAAALGGELPAAALLRVEEPAEQRGGVVAGCAEPVDGAVAPDEGAGAQVADQAVVGDRDLTPRSRVPGLLDGLAHESLQPPSASSVACSGPHEPKG